MFPSRVNTIEVPVITTTTAGVDTKPPVAIIQACKTDCSVRVRNNSYGQYVLIAFDAAPLQAFPAKADTWKIPAGKSDVFVLAQGQSLFVATPSGPPDGSNAEVSYIIYQDVPVVDQP